MLWRGGVFLAVSLNISFLDLSITTDAEMVWVKISPVATWKTHYLFL